jgi:hypothetical protein
VAGSGEFYPLVEMALSYCPFDCSRPSSGVKIGAKIHCNKPTRDFERWVRNFTQPASNADQADVVVGSKGDIPAPLAHFRFTPKSRHRPFRFGLRYMGEGHPSCA